MIKDYTLSYAQNREDVILEGFFAVNKITGFYVDVGSYDPTYDSVTKLFYDNGWHGLNIDPLPGAIEKFKIERPRDININIGIADKPGSLNLRIYKNQGLSTLSPDMQKAYKDKETGEYTDKKIKVTTLRDIFTKHNVDSIQFIKIDVEGLEHEVLIGNDWARYRPEVICIEANHIIKDWRPLLKIKGYTLVFCDGLNNYYVDTHSSRPRQFDYVKSVIMREPILNAKLLPSILEQDKKLRWLEATQRLYEADLEEAMVRIKAEATRADALQATLEEVIPLRNHLKRQLKRALLKLDEKFRYLLDKRSRYQPAKIIGQATAEHLLQVTLGADHHNYQMFRAEQKNWLLAAYDETKLRAIRTIRSKRYYRRRDS